MDVEEPVQESKDSGFSIIRIKSVVGERVVPTSTGSDDGGLLTRWDDETDVLENRSLRMVSERNILEFDIAPLEHKRFRIRRVLSSTLIRPKPPAPVLE